MPSQSFLSIRFASRIASMTLVLMMSSCADGHQNAAGNRKNDIEDTVMAAAAGTDASTDDTHQPDAITPGAMRHIPLERPTDAKGLDWREYSEHRRLAGLITRDSACDYSVWNDSLGFLEHYTLERLPNGETQLIVEWNEVLDFEGSHFAAFNRHSYTFSGKKLLEANESHWYSDENEREWDRTYSLGYIIDVTSQTVFSHSSVGHGRTEMDEFDPNWIFGEFKKRKRVIEAIRTEP